MRPLRRVTTVVFDCDSTLSAVEGIDELAVACRSEVEALTDAAMRGDLPLEAVYGRRLELIRPTRRQLEELAALYVERLVPDAVAVVAALRAEGIGVRVLSGGLLPAVVAVADALGIPRSDVAAVGISFDGSGGYAGFDEVSPLARSRGKCDVLAAWREDGNAPMMLVGDGATDAEAADAVDVFVAFAGVAERAAVTAAADAVVRSPSLAPVLPLALGGETPRLEIHRQLFDRGAALLDPQYRDRLNT
ncbi:MAG TPA: HAD-IB family phosphatase [Longimicrobiales bacterium]|nr:HAD-IB family phosphatase [Longimicrobiales bacterium]